MKAWNITGKDSALYNVAQHAAQGDEAAYDTIYPKEADTTSSATYGALVRSMNPKSYYGKRLRFVAEVRTDNIEGWAGLWMRLDRDPNKDVIVLDNMAKRPIIGTTAWQQYEIVLEVPEDTQLVLYGLILHGNGRAAIRDVRFDEVGSDVALTAEPTQLV